MPTRSVLVLLALAALAACSRVSETPDVGVTRLSPGQSLDCVGVLMRAEPVRLVPRASRGGWRRDVQVITGPPAGYVTKGALIHDGTVLAWLPDGATAGIADEAVRASVLPVLAACR